MTRRSPVSSRTVNRLRMLVKAGELLNSSLDLDRILDVLLRYTIKTLGATGGTIYLYDHKAEELVSHRMMGGKETEIRLKPGEGIAGHVAKTGKTVRIEDVYKDKRFYRGIDRKSGFRTRSMLCAPMNDRSGKLIGVFQILNKRRGTFTADDGKFLRSISIPATIAIENARLHQAEIETQRMQRDLELAAALQKQILPKHLPARASCVIDAATRPSRTVGGDFYDVIETADGRLILVVADASGKGIGAALLVSTLQAALHTYVEFGVSLREIATRLDRIIFEDSTSGSFITAFFMSVHPGTGEVDYVNAGHNSPLLLRSSGTTEELSVGGIPLGMLGNAQYEVGSVRLSEEDLIVGYTDGITELMSPGGTLYGEERFLKLLKKNQTRPVSEILSSIHLAMDRYAGTNPIGDDLTVLLLRFSPRQSRG